MPIQGGIPPVPGYWFGMATDPARSLTYQIDDGPAQACRVRLGIRAEESPTGKSFSQSWECEGGQIDAETTDAMIKWHEDNTKGVKRVRIEWLDSTGRSVGSASINGDGIIDGESETVKQPTVQTATDVATKDLLGYMLTACREKDTAMLKANETLANVANQAVRGIIQVGKDNSERAEGTVTMLLAQVLEAKDDARLSAVNRERDVKTPVDTESDLIKFMKEGKDIVMNAKSGGLASFLAKLKGGDSNAVTLLKTEMASMTDVEKANILALFAG